MSGVSHTNKTENKPEEGATNATMAVILLAIAVQVISASLFLWLLNKQDVESGYQFSRAKSERDQLKAICDSNALLDAQKEKWIEQNSKTKLPAEMSGQKPCQAATTER